jgi:DNA-binding transcriptional LysR family regulator
LQLRRVAEEPVVIAIAKRHPVAAFEKIDLARLENDPFLLSSREIAPGLYDTVVNACRKAGFEPIIGQVVPHMTAILNLVAQSSAYRSSRMRTTPWVKIFNPD